MIGCLVKKVNQPLTRFMNREKKSCCFGDTEIASLSLPLALSQLTNRDRKSPLKVIVK